ncbi:hypothetical protein GUJ93_ZPchr0010g8893 [Zizania palustris]|uniref:Uncharacterized protein n=1 Tax=Zizania palustris TaxID=103762 RepID=A0A8J5W191_ZIZPA|nr:hypothetical protein GUJ93_ZPchr0010g8893 [Zizania palustris]
MWNKGIKHPPLTELVPAICSAGENYNVNRCFTKRIKNRAAQERSILYCLSNYRWRSAICAIGNDTEKNQVLTTMQGCFPLRSNRRQSLRHGGGGGGVTVVSRGGGGGGGRVKIFVSEDELDRIFAGVTRRQREASTARRSGEPLLQLEIAAAIRRQRRPESEGGALVAARRGEWHPALDGIPEEEA